MAIHVPTTGAPLRAPIPAAIAAALFQIDREHLEALVDAAIAILDTADGDCDLEDDDPAGDILDKGEAASDDGTPIYDTLPRYRLDQRSGPTNEQRAHRLWAAAQLRPTNDPVPFLRRFA